MLLKFTIVFAVMAVLHIAGMCWADAKLRPGRLRREVKWLPNDRRPVVLPWPMTSIEAAFFLTTATMVIIALIAVGLWAGHEIFGRSPLILLTGWLAFPLAKGTAPHAYRLLAPRDLEQRHLEFEQQQASEHDDLGCCSRRSDSRGGRDLEQE